MKGPTGPARGRGAQSGRWLASLVAGLHAGLPGIGCGGPTSIDKAFEAAAANLATPEGRTYDGEIGRFLGAKFQPLVRACVDEVLGEMPVFTVLLQLDASGRPIDSEVWPIAPESECARDSLLSFEFPPPPKPAFWIQLDIRR